MIEGEISCIYYKSEEDREESLKLSTEIFHILTRYLKCTNPVLPKVRLLHYNIALFGRLSSHPTFQKQKRLKLESNCPRRKKLPIDMSVIKPVYDKIKTIISLCQSDCINYYTNQLISVMDLEFSN